MQVACASEIDNGGVPNLSVVVKEGLSEEVTFLQDLTRGEHVRSMNSHMESPTTGRKQNLGRSASAEVGDGRRGECADRGRTV